MDVCSYISMFQFPIVSGLGRPLKSPFLVEIPPSICDPKHVDANATDVVHTSLLDEKHKIIMSWMNKAACTKAVEMFWNGMHIESGVYYKSHPHSHRVAFEASCGAATK